MQTLAAVRPLLQATGAIATARAVSQLGWFTASLIVARAVGAAGFGRYGTLLAIAAIVVNGLGTGIPVLVLREASAGRLTGTLRRRLCATLGAVTGLGCIAVIVVGQLLGGHRAALEAACGSGYFAGVCFAGAGSSLCCGRGNYGRAAIGEALLGVCVPTFTVCGLAVDRSVTSAIVALLLAPIPAILWLFWKPPPLERGKAPPYRVLFGQSMSFVALGLASGGYSRMDTVALGLVASSRSVGIYVAAYRLVGPAQVLLSGFGTVFFSKMSAVRGRAQDWRPLSAKGQKILLGVMCPLVAILVFATPWLVRTLFGSAYDAAVFPARVLILTMLPVSISWPLGHTLNAFDRQNVWTGILIWGAAFDFFLVLVIGRVYGGQGAASVWLVTECLTAGLVLWARKWLPEQARGVAP